jgi:hypothetical protein
MKQLFGALLLLGLILTYWQLLLACAVVAVVVSIGVLGWREWRDESAFRLARRDALAARADQQDRWVAAGDPRGTYGECTYRLNGP